MIVPMYTVTAAGRDITQATCAYPECCELVTWPTSSGRPPMFCSAECRTACYQTVDELLAILDAEVVPEPIVLWQLTRYAAFVDVD